MKATGIVRRIDDLGRIVIPKEIRRTMRISRLSEACLGDDSLAEHIDTVRGVGVGAGEDGWGRGLTGLT